ncbi:hypothetical protein GHT06_008738 [Daphnia sinensis]|uniref:Uncharacterized protein n=1 Tax=Daphnia sinensis TaxID=1820382 RepID=A0AAD5L1W8_9CRUS|nr:hypothetical protein GHT06_008738 [Daphnia sinensis]
MVTIRKSTFVKCVAVAASLLLIGCLVGIIMMVMPTKEDHPITTDLQSSTMSGYSKTDQRLPDVTAQSPPVPGSHPDHRFESETVSLTESNIYDSSIKNPDINARNIEGRITPLQGFLNNDGDDDLGPIRFSHEAIPGLDEEMVYLLLSIVSRDSHPEIKTNVKTQKNLELEGIMMKLMTSIISRETNSVDRWKMAETLSSIVLKHGIDPDIKVKMSAVLHQIVNIHPTSLEVKLEIVKLISEVITQEADEVLKWKMLDTLLTIASHEIETETKSRLVTILSAIAREEKNLETQLKTATLLANMVRQYGRDETRANIQRILSLIVPSTEKLESTVEYTEESQLDSKSDVVDVIKKTTEVDFDERFAIINLLSNITQEEKAEKVASLLIELNSSIASPQYSAMKTSLNQIRSEVISAKNNFRKTDQIRPEVVSAKNHFRKTGQSAVKADVDQKSDVLNVLLNISQELKASESDHDEKSEMIHVFSNIIQEKTPKADFGLKSEMASTDVVGNEKAPDIDFDAKPEMVHILSNIMEG